MQTEKVTRQQRHKIEGQLKRVRIIPCDVRLTAQTGVGLFLEIFDKSPWAEEFKKCLPERVSHLSIGSYRLGLFLLAGHLRGVDSISSLKIVREDPYLDELFGNDGAAVRTLQDFLHDFTEVEVQKLNNFLNMLAKSIHAHLHSKFPDRITKDLVIDMDGTHHQHYGEAIEGVAYNYKNQWCLESHVAFDQHGFCHGIMVRPGNTKPGAGADKFIEQVFQDHRTQRARRLAGFDFFRGDSAYCNQFSIKKCLRLGIYFTITAHKGTTHWDRKMGFNGIDWQPWKYSKEELERAAATNHTLPEAFVGRFYWEPSWAEGTLKLPVVVKKTWMKFSNLKDKAQKQGQASIFELDTVKEVGDWEYYAVVTNFDLTRWSLQEVFEHHRKRGNSENFIREGKYNFALRNFPCEKLVHNNAWACFAQIAHNLLRWIAILENPERPSFAKKIRDDFVLIAGKISKGSRYITLRVPEVAKEVLEKLHGWQFPGFDPARVFSTA